MSFHAHLFELFSIFHFQYSIDFNDCNWRLAIETHNSHDHDHDRRFLPGNYSYPINRYTLIMFMNSFQWFQLIMYKIHPFKRNYFQTFIFAITTKPTQIKSSRNSTSKHSSERC